MKKEWFDGLSICSCGLKYSLLLLLCMVGTTLWAQTYDVTGTVKDEETQQPLGYASVQLLRTDSSQVQSVVANQEGKFILRGKGSGRYLLKFSFLGYKPVFRAVEWSRSRNRVDLGVIRLKQQAIALGNADVKGQIARVVVKGDTLVYNSDAFKVSPGSALSALIAQLPGVVLDKDGKLTWQGKTISRILVNGKDFFGTDQQKALENLPVEMVQSVKAYEKQDEAKEWRKEADDGTKEPVFDVTIRKKYMGNWTVNLDGAGGPDENYAAQAFGLRFSDVLRTTLVGSINNVSATKSVDGNGNWSFQLSHEPGQHVYRKGGFDLNWQNGKKRYSPGWMTLWGNVGGDRNNHWNDTKEYSETFLPGSERQYGRSSQNRRSRNDNMNVNLQFQWCPDSMTYVMIAPSFGYQNNASRMRQQTATYNTDPEQFSDPLGGLFVSSPDRELMDATVNSTTGKGVNDNENFRTGIRTVVQRKLGQRGNVLTGGVGLHYNSGEAKAFNQGVIRYYQAESAQKERIFHTYTTTPTSNINLNTYAQYMERLSKQASLSFHYNLSYSRSKSDHSHYQLDSLADWRNPDMPLTHLPSTADSLASVLSARNSLYTTSYNTSHRMAITWLQNWKRLTMNTTLSMTPMRERLEYLRGDIDTTAIRNRNDWGFDYYTRYKLNEKGTNSLTFRYNGQENYPSLNSRIDYVDDSNELSIQRGNPNLKRSWSDEFSLSSNFYFPKRELSVYGGGRYKQNSRSVANSLSYDTQTGVSTTRPENVTGEWSASAYGGYSLALDSTKRFRHSLNASANYNNSPGLVSLDGLSSVKNEMRRLSSYASTKLTYRRGWLNCGVELMGMWQRTSNTMQRDANENALDGYWKVEGQVDFPFGLVVGTEFYHYIRSNYRNEVMNGSQYIWDARVGYSFLKNKALTLSLQMADILRSRNYDLSRNTTYSRTNILTDMQLNYALFHVIYRFNTAKKG